ncbi:MAG: DUF1659 domain-containing protein [Sporolactobacillus sp.]|jgi:hypothetical protein|nr:DUF1659 domain-containing protein [Sporolactobacillus sp.]MCI1880922.1 DUF1659 domain-containing protein [Sporolactobacillus sp.]
MANGTITASALVMTFDGGKDENGDPLLVTKTFRNIEPGASFDALLAVASQLAPLQQHPLVKIERDDTSAITA